jgi:S-adenosylmethionine decarboxylase
MQSAGSGLAPAWRMTQMTDAALISGHFMPESGRAYIDLVCSRFYEPRAAAEFFRSFFRGDHYKIQVALRQ